MQKKRSMKVIAFIWYTLYTEVFKNSRRCFWKKRSVFLFWNIFVHVKIILRVSGCSKTIYFHDIIKDIENSLNLETLPLKDKINLIKVQLKKKISYYCKYFSEVKLDKGIFDLSYLLFSEVHLNRYSVKNK